MLTHRTVTKNRALRAKAQTHTVTRKLGTFRWEVRSGSSRKLYSVSVDPYTDTWYCRCKWGEYDGGGCSHVQAVLMHIEQDAGRCATFWASYDDAKRQRRPTTKVASGRDGTDLYMTSRKGAPAVRKSITDNRRDNPWVPAIVVKSGVINRVPVDAGQQVQIKLISQDDGLYVESYDVLIGETERRSVKAAALKELVEVA